MFRYLGIGNGISLALDRATHLWLQSKALPDLLRSNTAPPLAMVRSLAYFLPVIEEVLQLKIKDEYFQYIRRRLQRFNSAHT